MIFLAAAIGANVCMTFLMKYSETHQVQINICTEYMELSDRNDCKFSSSQR